MRRFFWIWFWWYLHFVIICFVKSFFSMLKSNVLFSCVVNMIWGIERRDVIERHLLVRTNNLSWWHDTMVCFVSNQCNVFLVLRKRSLWGVWVVRTWNPKLLLWWLTVGDSNDQVLWKCVVSKPRCWCDRCTFSIFVVCSNVEQRHQSEAWERHILVLVVGYVQQSIKGYFWKWFLNDYHEATVTI